MLAPSRHWQPLAVNQHAIPNNPPPPFPQAAAVVAGQRVGQYVRRHGVPMSDAVLEPDPSTAASYRKAMERSRALGELLFAGGRRW